MNSFVFELVNIYLLTFLLSIGLLGLIDWAIRKWLG